MLYVVNIQYFSEENIPLPIEKINKSSQNAKMRIFTSCNGKSSKKESIMNKFDDKSELQ